MSHATDQTTAHDAWADDTERARRLAIIRASIGRVHHDLSNPLSIITGNAQLFLEIASMMGLDDDLVQPVRDIEMASERMAELLDQLTQLKNAIPSSSIPAE